MGPENSENKPKFVDIEQIMKMIPHRYPFLMIDRVGEIVPKQSAVGTKNVTINESYFAGHFPGKPIMPGVLIIEAMAQTAAVFVIREFEDNPHNNLVNFMSIESARFRKPVLPGDTMKIHVQIMHTRGRVWKFEGQAFVDGALVAESRFAAMIIDQ